jgi:hypothetical protein
MFIMNLSIFGHKNKGWGILRNDNSTSCQGYENL